MGEGEFSAREITGKDAMRVAVAVRSRHLQQPPLPGSGDYWFAYHIRIENLGDAPFRLLARRWTITDGDNRVREVRGSGVVGEQPYLQPGAHYEYQSYVDMPTPAGTMSGAYLMRPDDGEDFEAQIPAFSLCAPMALN